MTCACGRTQKLPRYDRAPLGALLFLGRLGWRVDREEWRCPFCLTIGELSVEQVLALPPAQQQRPRPFAHLYFDPGLSPRFTSFKPGTLSCMLCGAVKRAPGAWPAGTLTGCRGRVEITLR